MASNLNLLNFKFGPQTRLPNEKSAGTIYVTTDERAMYIDLPNEEGELGRLRIGDIIVVQSAKTAQPPFSIGFYYFVEDNALLRWDGKNWTQVNSVSDIQGNITDLTKTVNAEKERSEGKDKEHDDAIKALQDAIALRVTTQAFEEFKSANSEAIAKAEKAGTDASAEAKAADKKATDAQTAANNAMAAADLKLPLAGGNMSGPIDMGIYRITSLGTPVDNADAVTKLYVDTAKSEAMTAAGNALSAAGTAKDRADEAYNLADSGSKTANQANAKANEAYDLAAEKTTMGEVEAKNYATKTEAQGYVNTLKGTANDTKDTVSVYGALAAAAAAKQAADDAQTTANSKTTMDEVIAKDYATKTEAQNYANAVLGSDADTAESNTVYGAHKAADAAFEKAEQGVSDAAAANKAAGDAQTTANEAKQAASEADTKAGNAQKAAEESDAKAVAANTNANTRLLQTDFEAFEILNDEAIADAKKAGTDAQTTANNAATAAGEAHTLAGQAKQAAADADAKAVAADTNANSRVAKADFETFKTENAGNIADAKKAGTDAQNTANNALEIAGAALPKAGGEMVANAEIKMNSGSISGLADLPVDANGNMAVNKNYVDAAIAAGIEANDAMTFKGTLGGTGATVNELPETAQKGDTYKVASAGTYAGTAAKVGDLFINNAEDNATASWVHISSGYEDDYLQKLVQDNNVIHLTDGISNTSAGSVSSFTVVGASNSNLNFTVSSNGNDLTITGSMIWGTF